MLTRVAVLVPGIMGSMLRRDDGTGKPLELWGENFLDNYNRLKSDSGLLDYTPAKKAEASLLRHIYAIGWWSWLDLWDGTIKFLDVHNEFGQTNRQIHFGYDWRQSLLTSADELAATLSGRAGSNVAQAPGSDQETRFVIIAHSMGGLLTHAALGLGKIHPGWLDRLFTIGSPLRGAPKSLNTLYGEISPLPYLNWLIRICHPANGQVYLDRLRRSFKTFPSAYQLIPHVTWKFLWYGPTDLRSPLSEAYIPLDFREAARDAHNAVAAGAKILQGTKVIAIYTDVYRKEWTQLMYRVQPLPEGYNQVRIEQQNELGDGTVPLESARALATGANNEDVQLVVHHKMCNDSNVVKRLKLHINN